jgi:hypothetical protein
MSQSSYLALPARLTGFQTGLASSQQLNKAWRQSSIISAMIAQFICDKTGLDALDDGTIATLEARFIQALGQAARVPMLADLNLFVSTTGNDNNNGQSSGQAVQTLQRAVNIAQQQYDTQGHDIVINVAAGTYTAGASVTGQLVGGGRLRFVGNTASPSSVVISLSTADSCFNANGAARVAISGFQLTAPVGSPSVSGICINTNASAQVQFDHVNFGTAVYAHMLTSNSSAIFPTGFASSVPYNIVGGAQYHVVAGSGAGTINLQNMIVTITGSPAFSGAFAWMDSGGLFFAVGTTWSPSPAAATGQRHLITNGGILVTHGGGNLPGSVAGVGGTATGGGWAS